VAPEPDGVVALLLEEPLVPVPVVLPEEVDEPEEAVVPEVELVPLVELPPLEVVVVLPPDDSVLVPAVLLASQALVQ